MLRHFATFQFWLVLATIPCRMHLPSLWRSPVVKRAATTVPSCGVEFWIANYSAPRGLCRSGIKTQPRRGALNLPSFAVVRPPQHPANFGVHSPVRLRLPKSCSRHLAAHLLVCDPCILMFPSVRITMVSCAVGTQYCWVFCWRMLAHLA